MTDEFSRRPIKARNTKWAAAMARGLIRCGLRPNAISVMSAVFGLSAGVAFVGARFTENGTRSACFVAATICIQARLLCNLFDGMVAVEGGFRTKSGEIFNELPDRFSDVFILVGAGYSLTCDAVWLPTLGWIAGVLALMTAYVRALGASAGAGQHFHGPMAKQHRMAIVTAAALANALTAVLSPQYDCIGPALLLVALGCVVTIVRRCWQIIHTLESR